MVRQFAIVWCLLLFVRVSAQGYQFYFGNLHAHTGFSDGNKDSASSGVFQPYASFLYAKQSKNFDFLGISEHNHYSSAHNPGFRLPLYSQGLNMADMANEDGKFVALYGMEYGVSSEYNGHLLVYNYPRLIGWESNVGGVQGDNFEVFNARSDYKGLFDKINRQAGAFCFLAHPNFTDYSTAGNYMGALANAPYDASVDSAVTGMPLRSGLATNAGDQYKDYPAGHYFNYYKRLLYLGYHLGIGYDHDNHFTNFGRGNAGRLVVLATKLSRDALFDAIRHMRFYGSDDANARVTFELNDAIMGSSISGDQYPSIKIVHDDGDGELADTIRIWRGRPNSGGLWAEPVYEITRQNTAIFVDTSARGGYEYFYFGEIRQQDQQWIVTSPVWYRAGSVLKQGENSRAQFAFFPNPASHLLYLTFADLNARVTISDMQGRVLHESLHLQSSAVLDISFLPKGTYMLKVNVGTQMASSRLVIN